MILIYILTFFILFYILSLCDINTILILLLLFLLMKHYESSIYKPKDTEIKIYEFEKTKFIDKIDKERYIILMNSIKEYNRLYNKIKIGKYKIEKYYDYMYDIYTTILEICYSLHIEKLKSKNIERLNNLIEYIRNTYYKMLMELKDLSKNKHLLKDYEIVPYNYRKTNLMLP